MNLKRIISLVLAAAMMMSMVYTGAVVSFADETEAGTYFYSSFEVGAEGQTTLPLADGSVDKGADGKYRASGMGEISTGSVKAEVKGSFTDKVTKVDAPDAASSSSAATNLLDGDVSTTYRTSSNAPMDIIYTLSEASVLGEYSVGTYYASYYGPRTWKIYGSNDGAEWTELHSVENFSSGNAYGNSADNYKVENETAYTQYKMSITATNVSWGNFYLADWIVGTGVEEGGDPEAVPASLKISNSSGPSSVWNNDGYRGWTGSNALKVEGSQSSDTAYSYNVIYENVNVKVTDKTKLSYMIFPDYSGYSYDFEYTSMHTAVDLKFTDGTYLSDYNVIDQNKDVVSPRAQGESRALFTKQWNTIASKIGKYEALQGKVIDKILVGFEKHGKQASGNLGILAYIDDIKIEEAEDKVYENALAYTMTRRGSESSETFSRGLNQPGTVYPNGANFWAMATSNGGSPIYKFQPGNHIAHVTITHEASHWTGERGTMQFMVNTSVDPNAATTGSINYSSRRSDYDRDTLVDQANYLKIDFKDGTPAAGSTLELVPTDHAASVKFSFDDNAANRNIIFDSIKSSGNFEFAEDGSFSGYTTHRSNGFGTMYFYGTFSVEPSVKKVISASGVDVIVGFPEGTKEVVMNMATSLIDVNQAKHNLSLEIGDKTWAQVYDDTEAAWLEIFNRVEVEGATEEELITFWSSMYRMYMYPNNLSENVGTEENPDWKYRSPYSGAVTKGYKYYYNNGFWDVYRTTPSAYALLTPTRYTEFLDGFVQHYIDQGWIPRWVAPGGTNSMVGTSSDVMIADAYVRGITDFDYENGYLASLRNGSAFTSNPTNGGRAQTQLSNFVGYVNSSQGEGFSWSIEGYINDAGIAKMAEKLGDKDNAVYYGNRALNYVKLFNPEVNFFMGRRNGGSWTTSASSFNPKTWKQDDNYTETNAWNMAFSIVYDGQGLANLYGGKDALADKLDQFFTEKGDYNAGGYGGEIHEMREAREIKLGQYGHSNQPSHHIIFMYNYTNEPWKTQYYARDILDRVYVGSSIAQGYPGDEDNGESSAWYVQAAMGLYAVNMGSGNFTFTSPLFDKVTIHQENGKDLVLKANNNSIDNVYIQSLTVGGQPYNSTMISHEDLINAGEIVFEMGPEPSNWGVEDGPRDSLTKGDAVAIPMDDVTNTNIVDQLPDAASTSDAMYIVGNVTNANRFFDNNGANYATVNGNKVSIYSYFANSKVVELYTIGNYTSTTNVPDAAALYASNDGETWVELDSRTDVSFRWPRYVEPFAVENSTPYKYYRLDLSSKTAATMDIAEVELYAYFYSTATKEMLLSKINEAKALDPDDYGASFDALNAAIAEAEELYNNENAEVLEIYNMIEKLNNEIKPLDEIRSAKARLLAKINEGKALDPDDFNTSFDALNAVIAEAEGVYADKNVTVSEINAMITKIANEIKPLGDIRDAKANLLAKINEAKALDPNDYETSFDALNAVVAEAETLYADKDATLTQLNEMITKVNNELKVLTDIRDARAALLAKINEAKAIDSEQYETSLEALNTAIADAEALLGNKAATAKELNDMISKLAFEIKELDDVKAARATLLETINRAKALDPNDYPVPLDAIMALVDEAEALYANLKASSADLKSMSIQINNQIDGLGKIVDGFTTIEAENYSAAASGIVIDRNSSLPSGANVGGCKVGLWLKYDYINFGKGASGITVRYARQGSDTGTNPHINIYIDGKSEAEGGTLVGSFYPEVTAQNSWNTYRTGYADLDKIVTGVHTVFFMLEGNGNYVGNFDYFQFEKAATLDVTGDISMLPYNTRTFEIATSTDVESIKLYDANNEEIAFDFIDYTDDGDNRVFTVDVSLEDNTIGTHDVKFVGQTAGGTVENTVTLTTVPFATSAVTDADEYIVGNSTIFTIVADEHVKSIALASESGKFISKIAESSYSNGDGTNTWIIVAKFDTKGARTINILAAGADRKYYETGLSTNFNVDIAVSEGDAAVEVLSVRAQQSAGINEVFTLTVVTSTSASKVGIFSETGSALGKVSQSYVDKNGERTWTITMKVGSKGMRTFDVKATDKTGEWSEAKSFNIEIIK